MQNKSRDLNIISLLLSSKKIKYKLLLNYKKIFNK